MKALTIWQPWASLIMAGAKPYEFRRWKAYPSLVGQRIVIHAAARKIDAVEASYLYNVIKHRNDCDELKACAAETCLFADKALPVLGDAWFPYRIPLPLACGLGTAILGDPRNGLEIAEEFGISRANDSDRDDHANWGWPLSEIEVWDEPIPMSGKQGFWNWPEPQDLGL